MAWTESLYTVALAGLRPALALASRGDSKLARGVRGRRGAVERLAAWSPSRDPGRPLVWVHAPSVGEGLQARAVVEEFRHRNPAAQIAFTFFSPSAEALASAMPADVVDYLPWDLPDEVGAALDLLRPDVVAFSKTDVWPNLTREADRRGIRMAMLSGTLPASSSRLRGPARMLLGPAYSRLERVAAISEDDAARFERLGVSPARISVMGDAHFDRVLQRAAEVDLASELLRPLSPRADQRTIVAGSTWPADEERLLPVIAGLRAADPGVRAVVVPHEPGTAHLESAERAMDELGLPHRRLTHLRGDWAGEEVLLVDRVGVLGQLYALADLAYVGGGWGTAGLHSVLEPAAFGVPVVFGPRHANAREAGELVVRGGAFSVTDQPQLDSVLRRLLTEPPLRSRAGSAALSYVEAGRGAAERGARLLEELLTGPRG